MPHINDVLMNAVNGLEKPELTCISEEGIAGKFGNLLKDFLKLNINLFHFLDMDLPDNILDDFDFNQDDNDEEVITSCNKVRNFFISKSRRTAENETLIIKLKRAFKESIQLATVFLRKTYEGF